MRAQILIAVGFQFASLIWATAARAQLAPGPSAARQQQQAGESAQRAAAAEAERQEQQRRLGESAQLLLRVGLDPTRIHTIGVWPDKEVPCKLPKSDEPYHCRRLLQGPAIILSRVPLELIAAHDDQALERGDRLWWLHNQELMPIALAPGEILYVLGELRNGDTDIVLTVYRP
jgi:hypothetical protein